MKVPLRSSLYEEEGWPLNPIKLSSFTDQPCITYRSVAAVVELLLRDDSVKRVRAQSEATRQDNHRMELFIKMGKM